MIYGRSAVVLSICVTASYAIQPGAAPAQPAALRDLEFGDINFLHTTDTHGWHAGHLYETSFSADWGDYVSFSERLREKLEAEGKDLLVIDTGDRIEGNGLYDASNPRGEYTFGIFKQQHIDLLCSGNHELYKNSSAEDDFEKLLPAYKENYLASNLQIRLPKNGDLVPLGKLYRKFATKNGVQIMAFGFIFDFTRNDKITVVTPVEMTVKQSWFTEAVSLAKVDLFIVIGHIGLRQAELGVIYHAIRALRPDIPIQFFGGHFHIRDYRVFDDKAHALASGRFMETIGFQSISNLKSDNINFSRRYIDNNLFSLHHHSNTTSSTFSTSAGLYTTRKIARAREKLNLDETFGCAPQSYWMSRAPYPANDSVYSLLTDQVFPDLINPSRKDKTRLVLTNTGAIRFDIFEGPFTRDSTFIVSPFTSNLSYIPDVPYRLAKQLLPILNGGDRQTVRALGAATFNKKWKFHLSDLTSPEQQARNHARLQGPDAVEEPIDYHFMHYWNNDRKQRRDRIRARGDFDTTIQTKSNEGTGSPWAHDTSAQQPVEDLSSAPCPITPGYTTLDDLGRTGDDTIHSPITFYDVPNVVQAIFPSPSSSVQPNITTTFHPTDATCERQAIPFPSPGDDEVVDLIFNEFLTPYIIYILNILPHYCCPSDVNSNGLGLSTYEPYSKAEVFKFMSPRDVATLSPCVVLGLCEDQVPRDAQEFLDGVTVEMEKGTEKQEWDAKVADFTAKTKRYTEVDVSNYLPGETFTTLFAKWIETNWKNHCKTESDEHLEL